jgi:hypothetical protein
MRLHVLFARASQGVRLIVAAVGSVLEELAVAAGAALITVALWPHAGITALAVPGLVLLWIALPTRTAFVSRPVEPPSRRKT